MNLFVLSRFPVAAAAFACDKHMGKMILESAQILYNVLLVHWGQTMPHVTLPDGTNDAPYKPINPKHPIVLWAAASEKHALWVATYATALAVNNHVHTGKWHKSSHHINSILSFLMSKAGTLQTPLTLDQFVAAYPKHAHKVSTLDAPEGCEYGIVCTDITACFVYYKGRLSVVDSYRRLYAHKAKFEFEMLWYGSSDVPTDLRVWFETYRPEKPMLKRKRAE